MNKTTAFKMINSYRCFFCGEPADRIGYYSKIYYNGKESKENPTFFCERCWTDKNTRNQINPCRGGMESVYCLTFKSLAKMSPKSIGFFVAKKTYESNSFSMSIWRKTLFSLHYLCSTYKEEEHGEKFT